MSYWQLFYHLIWATQNREPLLTGDIEDTIYGFMRSKAIGLGAKVFAMNGTTDHVHLVVAIPPNIAVSKFVGQVKAVASTRFNKSGISRQPFFWQGEYGAFSFDGKRLPNYITYVERQKEHHARRTVIPILERIEEGNLMTIHEQPAIYTIDSETWWQELVGES
jgi:REP element-mobilizing transposase RayT